jgi:hypothetical protein
MAHGAGYNNTDRFLHRRAPIGRAFLARVLKVSVVFLCPQFPSAPWRSVIFPFAQRRTAAQ